LPIPYEAFIDISNISATFDPNLKQTGEVKWHFPLANFMFRFEPLIDISNISATFDSNLDDRGSSRSLLACIRHWVIFDMVGSLDGKRKFVGRWQG
jgi:hypothetical protein